jgi:hypothetical protein
MAQTVFGDMGWDGPPTRVRIDIFPAHRPHFTPTLCRQEAKRELRSGQQIELPRRLPNESEFVVG